MKLGSEMRFAAQMNEQEVIGVLSPTTGYSVKSLPGSRARIKTIAPGSKAISPAAATKQEPQNKDIQRTALRAAADVRRFADRRRLSLQAKGASVEM